MPFYSDWDQEEFRLHPRTQHTEVLPDLFGRAQKASSPHRPEFSKDRDRIIHCSAFRRLQGKTQVFLAGEYDFYRTRLTHSMEVAQIGRGIVFHLNESLDGDGISAEIVEAACLAHDLGNPPFGHPGEAILNDLMSGCGGFEGNAQSVREVCRLMWRTTRREDGMRPSRAFLDAIFKYKRIPSGATAGDSKFLYPEQTTELEFLFDGKISETLSRAAEEYSAAVGQGIQGAELKPHRSRMTRILESHRSVEAQIMDWADNTAYSLFDVSDGFRAGFIDAAAVRSWVEAHATLSEPQQLALLQLAAILDESKNVDRNALSVYLARTVGTFIGAASLAERADSHLPPSNRYRWKLELQPEIVQVYEAFRDLARDLVYESARVEQLRFKTGRMLRMVTEALLENYEKPQPRSLTADATHRWILQAHDRASRLRRVCDYLAGSTDDYLIRIYRRLFESNAGSLTDLT